MVEIAEANEDRDHNYFLAKQFVLYAASSSSLCTSTKTALYLPYKNKIFHTLVDILAYQHTDKLRDILT